MRQITDQYFVSPQICVDDIPAIKDAGICTIINNRPDGEIPPSHCGDVIAEAAQQAGIEIVHLPITHQSLTPDNIARQCAVLDQSDGAVLAYCASGTRSTIIWRSAASSEERAMISVVVCWSSSSRSCSSPSCWAQ